MISFIRHANGMSLHMLNKRKQIRLVDFDYSSPNAYFITICVRNFELMFGEIKDGIMILSEVGKIANEYLQKIHEVRSNVSLNEASVMPNHLHCILELSGLPLTNTGHRSNKFGNPLAGSISVIINQYKGDVKKWCNLNGHKSFEWQGRFYDHVIRDEKSYRTIKNYILTNAVNWKDDKFHR